MLIHIHLGEDSKWCKS